MSMDTELERECMALRAERDALAADLANQRARALSECDRCPHDIDNQKLLEERDTLAAKLAELGGQEPVAWIYDWQAPEGLIKGWVETNRDAIPEHATNIRPLYARPIPADPANVEFGMRGENMFFKIGNQSFLLDYKPAEPGEFEFMQKMLLSAFSSITPCVKTASEPVNARLLEALKAAQAYVCGPTAWTQEQEDTLVEAMSKAIAEAQQERLLQDMHDAGREVDRVMAEAAPKAVRLTHADIAKALASAGLKPEDYREDGEILPLVIAIESAALRKNGIEVAE